MFLHFVTMVTLIFDGLRAHAARHFWPRTVALVASQWRLWLTVYDGTQFGFDTQTTHRERPHATALMLAVMSVTLVTWRPRQTTVELACVRLRSNTCCLAPFHSILITWATVCYTGCYKHFAVHTTAVWQAKLFLFTIADIGNSVEFCWIADIGNSNWR